MTASTLYLCVFNFLAARHVIIIARICIIELARFNNMMHVTHIKAEGTVIHLKAVQGLELHVYCSSIMLQGAECELTLSFCVHA